MRTIALLYLLICCTAAFGQIEVSISAGYGFYSMSEMKRFQDALKRSFPTPEARITEKFPAYYFFLASGKKVLTDENILTGLTLSYASTGGRVHYSDYSASIGSDQLLSCFSIQPSLGTQWRLEPEKLLLTTDVKPSITFSKMELTSFEQVQNLRNTDSYDFRSINLAIEPTLFLTKRILDYGVTLFVGYYLTIYEGKIHLKDNKDAHLTTPDGDEVHLQWDGLRAGAGLTYFLD